MRNKFEVYIEDNEMICGDYRITLGKIEKIAFESRVELQYEESAKYYHLGVEVDEIPKEIHNEIINFINNQQSIF
jgi:hypothetical protein